MTPFLADYDETFNGNYNDFNLVARTDTAAAFSILAIIFTTFAFVRDTYSNTCMHASTASSHQVTTLFGLGRIGYQPTIVRAAKALGIAGVYLHTLALLMLSSASQLSLG